MGGLEGGDRRSSASLIAKQGRRARFAVLLALTALTLAALATSSLGADEPEQGGAAEQESLAPSQEAEEKERARREREEEKRRTPEARRKRRESQTAHADASDSEARELAKRRFRVLEEPLWEPPELRDDERLGEFLGDHAQLVERGNGEAPSVIDSLIPLRARNASGKQRPLDIGLKGRGRDFEPENAIVDTRLGGEAADGVAFQASGVRIRPLGRDQGELEDLLEKAAKLEGPAQRAVEKAAEELMLGRPKATASKLEEKLFYADTEADTDLVLAPVPTGVEIFYVLRSKESPEEQALEFDLPDGAELRRVDGGDGAEVVDDGERVMSIAPPKAYDATGKEIPATYEVDGDRLIVEVPHRSEDILYPGLVDPVVEEQKDWELNPTVGYQGWAFSPNYPGFDRSLNHPDYGRGLTIEAPPGTLDHKAASHFHYEAPGNAFIYDSEFWYAEHEPYSSFVTRALVLPDTDNDPNGEAVVENSNRARSDTYGTEFQPPNAGICARSGCPVAGTQGNRMQFQLRMTDGPRYRERRTLAHLGGARVYLHDNFNPKIEGLVHDPPLGPGGWTNRLDHKVAIRGTDGGLGVKKVFFNGPLGVREDRVDRLCTAQCPREKTEEFTYAADDGLHTIQAQVADNVERNSVISEWPVKVDRVAPTMATSGTLKESAGTWRTTGGALRIEAKDEEPLPLARPQGGVTSIDVLVDGERVDGATQPCEPGGCPLTHEFAFPDERYPDGKYDVKVVVTDQAGNKAEEDYTVRLDRQGPALTVTGNLYEDYRPGGRYSREALYDPEYLVDVEARDGSVTDLQSGISKVEFRVDGQVRPTDTRVQPCALGSCSLTSSFKLFTDEYPDGPHTVSVVATDHAGQTTEVSWPVIVDRRGDIYTAKEQAGPVPDFEPDITNEREWARINTHDARMQDQQWIATRTTKNADGDEPYDEVRRVSRLSDDEDPETGEPYPDQEEAWTEKRGSSPDDPDLPVVASILEPKKYFDEEEEPVETGEIHAALAPGQQPPPAYGPTFEVHERDAEIEEEDGSRTDGTARFWIDGRTRMPIKQVVTREGGEHYVSAFWNYHHSRFERSEKSDDFFSIGKPDDTGMEKEERDNGLGPLGGLLDEETDILFSPYFVGETVTLSTGPYVLADTKIVKQRLSAQTALGAPDPDLRPEDEAPAGRGEPFTDFSALYQPNPGGLPGFRPGLSSSDAPLTVRSMAKGSSQARIWRDTYIEQGTRTEVLRPPGSLGLADGKVIAYVLSARPGRTSALFDTGDSTLIVQGPFTPEELGQLIERLGVL